MLQVLLSFLRRESLPFREKTGEEVVEQSGECYPIVPVRCEIGDLHLREHFLCPLQDCLSCRFDKVRYVSHHAQLVKLSAHEVFRRNDGRDFEVDLCRPDGEGAVAEVLSRVEAGDWGGFVRLDLVDEREEGPPVPPVRGKVGDFGIGKERLHPVQHEFFSRDFCICKD